MERQRRLNEKGISRGEGCYSFIHHWKHKTLKAENNKDEGDGREGEENYKYATATLLLLQCCE